MSKTGAVAKHPKKTGAKNTGQKERKTKATKAETAQTKLPALRKAPNKGNINLATIKRVVKTVSDARKKK